MNKLLGILVLGLLLSSNAYAETIENCSVDSGEISGQDVDNKLDNIYRCESDDTFDLDEGQYVVGVKDRIDLENNSADRVIINNSGWIESTKNGSNAISGDGADTVTLNNKSTGTFTGTIKSPNAIYIGAGSNWEIDNYGDIYGTAAKAINIKDGDNNKITNRSGAEIKADGVNSIIIWGDSATSDNTIIENYGTITATQTAVKIGAKSTSTTVTNYSGGIIQATTDDGTQRAGIQIDAANSIITNKGTISGAGNLHSIEIKDNVSGT